jgi:hypothetical protein
MAPPGDEEAKKSEAQARAAKRLAVAKLEAADAFGKAQDAELKSIELSKQSAQQTNAQREALQNLIEKEIAHAEVTGRSAEAIHGLTKALKASQKAGEGLGQITSSIQNSVGGMVGATSQWTGNITATFMAAKGGGQSFAQTLDNLAKEANKAGSRMDKFGSRTLKVTEVASAGMAAVVAQTMKVVGAIDQATVSFKRSTGASEEFVRAIPALESQFYTLGLSAEDAANVMGSLYGSMSNFTRMGPQSQKAIRDTTAVLETLGIDASASAKNMEILTRSMGFSGTQASNITGQLFGLAQQLNVSTTQMMEDFTRLGPQLTVHGSRAVQVFAQLESAAKQSGIEVGRLLSIAEQFDTFKTAADSVGFLNAQLGGPYLSVMKMVEATNPTERMRMLSQATREAGLSFDTMEYYQRKALASAMGLADVNELALVMNGRFKLLGDSTRMNSREIEKLAEENSKYKTVQQELQKVMRQLAPVVTSILNGVRSFLTLLQNNAGGVQFFTSVIFGLKAGMLALNTAATLATMGMGTFGAATGGIALGIGVAVTALGLFSFAMMHEQHSPPLFGEKNSSMQLAAQQTYGLGSAFQFAGAQARSTAPEMKRLAMELNSMPDSKMIRIQKVFNAEEGVVTASKGSSITSNTIRLLGAATAGSAGGSVIQNHMDMTVEMDGRVVAHQVKRQLSA